MAQTLATDPRLKRLLALGAQLPATSHTLFHNHARLRVREPERFYLPPYIGKRGWFGLRLDRGRIDWNEVANLLEFSYCLAAPKALAAQVRAAVPEAPASLRNTSTAPGQLARKKHT